MKKLSLWVLLTLTTGCASNQHYYWGEYEGLVYKMYNKPGQATPAAQVDLLTRDIEKAQAAGKPIPPGVYAHLGYMHVIQGNVDQSKTAFFQEKALYPESTVLMDKMLGNDKTKEGK